MESGQLQLVFSLFSYTKNSDRPIALLATQIRSWNWVRADIMEDWERHNPIEWNVPTKEAGGGECTEPMLELEPLEVEAINLEQSQDSLIYKTRLKKATGDSGMELENVRQLHSSADTNVVRRLCASRKSIVRRAPVQTYTALLPSSKFSVVL